MYKKIARIKRALALGEDERWEFNLEGGIKLDIFGPDHNEGRWVIRATEGEESHHAEFASKEEVSRYLQVEMGIEWDADGSYFPEIGDRHGEKPSFFRHTQDADMSSVENPAKYHSDFLNYKRYSN